MSPIHEQYSLDDADIVAALREQEPYVRSWLLTRGQANGVDDVMGQVAEELLRSLPRWNAAGRPKLGAWARGVATNSMRTWMRSPGAGNGPGGRFVSLDALAEAGFDVAAPVMDFSHTAVACALVTALEAHVLSAKNGAATWAQLVGVDGRPRGQRACARLRQELGHADPLGALGSITGIDAHRRASSINMGTREYQNAA